MKKIKVIISSIIMMVVAMGFVACCNTGNGGSGGNTPILAYKIVATATSGGTITPSGEILLLSTATQTYKMEAVTGNYIKTLKVNNNVIDLIEGITSFTYTFSSLSSDSTISVEFASLVSIELTETTYKGDTLINKTTPTIISKDNLQDSNTSITIPYIDNYNISSINIIAHRSKNIIINIGKVNDLSNSANFIYTIGIEKGGTWSNEIFSINNDLVKKQIVLTIKNIKNDVQVVTRNQAKTFKYNFLFKQNIIGSDMYISQNFYSDNSNENIAFYGDKLDITFFNERANGVGTVTLGFKGWNVYRVEGNSKTLIKTLANNVPEIEINQTLLLEAIY
ncbi:MAG: hypothetical protein RR334_03585 [Clostridia bacterium]